MRKVMRVKLTLEYDSDESLESERESWENGAVAFWDLEACCTTDPSVRIVWEADGRVLQPTRLEARTP